MLNDREVLGPYNRKEGRERFKKFKEKWKGVRLLLVHASEVDGDSDGDE